MQMSVFCTLLPYVVYYNLWLIPKYVNVIGLHKAEQITPGHKNQPICKRRWNSKNLQHDAKWLSRYVSRHEITQLDCGYFVVGCGSVFYLGLWHFAINDGGYGECKIYLLFWTNV